VNLLLLLLLCCACRRGRVALLPRSNPLSIDPAATDAMMLGSSYSLSHVTMPSDTFLLALEWGQV
jgi:hypothetical protein